jgi:zinc protease
VSARQALRGIVLALFLCAGCANHQDRQEHQDRFAVSQGASSSVDYGEESYRLVSNDDEIISSLRNGLVVIVKRTPSAVCAVRAYALTGGVYEGKWLGGGLSHLLEHLVAGGTNGRRTEEQNRDLLQSIGNNSNAYTDYDHTAFFVNTTNEHLDEAVDLVAGWMFTAAITPAEYQREYEVVQRELEKDKGQPDDVFAELSFDNRYRVSPARVPVIGYQEVIQGLSRDDVYSYYKLAYQPNNMVFAVSGDLPPAQMLAAVQKNVRDYAPGRVFGHDISAEPQVTAPRTLVATFPKLGSAKLDLSFPSVRMDNPDVYALDLLAIVLGGGESSILVEEIRDKRQLVEDISASDFTPPYVEGSFSVTMTVDPEKLRAATSAALDEIEQIKSQGIDESRLSRAKTQLRVNQIKARQTTEGVISQLAIDFISSGDAHFSDHYLQRIDQVTPEQVQDAARRYLERRRLLTTALMPRESSGASDLPRAEDVLRAAAPTTRPASQPAVASKITRVELPNGLVLLHKRIPTSPMVVMKMAALGGLTAEDARTNGIGDLTMSLLPRGTASERGTRSAQQIAEELDATGADIDADCGSNTWTWTASCLKADFARTADLFNDVVQHPSFPGDEIAAMKQRTLAAIDELDADWFQQGIRYFKAKYYGPMNSPYQFLTIGTTQNVKAFTADQMKRWYAEKVLKAPRVISIFGDVDLETAKNVAMKLPGAPAPKRRLEQIADEGRGVRGGTASLQVTRVEMQQTEQPLAGIFIGFKSDSTLSDPRRFAFDLADCMTSGYEGPTGYLFDTLRGRGLVYQADAQDSPGLSEKLPGTFLAYAGCDPKNVNEVVDLMLLNIARLQGSPKDVQEDWFDRSKRLIVTQDALDHETPESQATNAAMDELYGLGYDAHEKFADEINAVSLDQVRSVARGALSQCVITISTPKPELVNVKTGQRTYPSFPPVELTSKGVQHDAGGGAVK